MRNFGAAVCLLTLLGSSEPVLAVQNHCNGLENLSDATLAAYVDHLNVTLAELEYNLGMYLVNLAVAAYALEQAEQAEEDEVLVPVGGGLIGGIGLIQSYLQAIDAMNWENRIERHRTSRSKLVKCLQQREYEEIARDPTNEEDTRHVEDVSDPCFWNPWLCGPSGHADPQLGGGPSSPGPVPDGEVDVEESPCQGPPEECVPGYGDGDSDDGSDDGGGGG